MTSLQRRLCAVLLPAVAIAVSVAGLRVAHARLLSTPPATPMQPYVPSAVHTALPATAAAHKPAPTHEPAAAAKPTPVPAPAPTPAPPLTAVYTVTVNGVNRQWLQDTPGGAFPASTPILVFLHGSAVTPQQEMARDGLTPLVDQGKAELVYPQGVGTTWNAGGCCGLAMQENVDDVGFITALIAQVDPGHVHPLTLIGYSNGGRLAYTLACENPGLVDDYVVIGAVPVGGCATTRPFSILQVDGTADLELPYAAATAQVARLRSLDSCTGAPATATLGHLTIQTSGRCSGGTRVVFATYQGADHHWPAGDATTPNGGRTIWSFVSGGAPW